MIIATGTMSLKDIKPLTEVRRWKELRELNACASILIEHPVHWLGFEDGDQETRSPLSKPSSLIRGPAVVMVDLDREGRDAFLAPLERVSHEPAAKHADVVVNYVRGIEEAPEACALIVHCYAGIWRSGAVLTWIDQRIRRGLEAPDSRRMMNGSENVFNRTFLRLLIESDENRTRLLRG